MHKFFLRPNINMILPFQLLYEFSRYSELISRPLLKYTLLGERQYLLTALQDYVKQLQTQTSADMNYLGQSETPMIVKELMMTRQLESRAREVQTTSEKLLDDLEEFDNLNSTVVELLKELKKQHMELFDSWTSEITRRINDNTLRYVLVASYLPDDSGSLDRNGVSVSEVSISASKFY